MQRPGLRQTVRRAVWKSRAPVPVHLLRAGVLHPESRAVSWGTLQQERIRYIHSRVLKLCCGVYIHIFVVRERESNLRAGADSGIDQISDGLKISDVRLKKNKWADRHTHTYTYKHLCIHAWEYMHIYISDGERFPTMVRTNVRGMELQLCRKASCWQQEERSLMTYWSWGLSQGRSLPIRRSRERGAWGHRALEFPWHSS
mgnify:CR=1 FL=1